MKFFKTFTGTCMLLAFVFVTMKCTKESKSHGPYQATGLKIGEVTGSQAIIWTRLSKDSLRVNEQAPEPKILYQDDSTGEWHPVDYFKKKYRQDRPDRKVKVIYPEGYDVHSIDGAVPGTLGELRIAWMEAGAGNWKFTPWQSVDSVGDYTAQFILKDLKAGTQYTVKAEARALGMESSSNEIVTDFRTAPAAQEVKNILFTVSTCQEYHDQDMTGGFKIYPAMKKLQPDFYVNAGDILYYDHYAKNLPLAMWQWQQMYSLSTLYGFHNHVPSYFIKDDHDTWMNDSYPGKKTRFMGDFTFEQGKKLFLQEVPMGDKTYRTIRWGKDLQVWLVEGRDFRSPNEMADGPEKTIWGKEQMEWFEKTINDSDATFKVLISPTPIVGPDRPQKKDNHANSGFKFEGNRIKDFLSKHKNIYIICGDRHWQYVSKDSRTGLMEFSIGAASNEHAGGWNQEDVFPEHRYLNVTGGFLSVSVQRDNTTPVITFSHRDVNGEILHTEKFNAENL